MKLVLFLFAVCTLVALFGTLEARIECAGCELSRKDGEVVEDCTLEVKEGSKGINCGADFNSPVNFCRTEFSDAGVVTNRHCADPDNFKFDTIKTGCYKVKFNGDFSNKTVLKKTCFCNTKNCNKHTVYDGKD